MASWKEIERVRKDVGAARSIAQRLLQAYADFTDWEKDYLESMARLNNDYVLSTRQAEKLLQIRDDCEEVANCRGFSVSILIQKIYEARLDLSEADEEWITRIHEQHLPVMKRRYIGRLLRCAHEVSIIEDEIAA